MNRYNNRRNLSFIKATLLSGLFFYGAWKTWYLQGSPYAWVPIVFVVIALLYSVAVIRSLASTIHEVLLLWEAYGPSEKRGTAAWASPKELKRAGLHQPKGMFLGCDTSGHPLFVDVETHGLTLSPAGKGKTINTVIPNLCHLPYPIITTDMKGNLAVMTHKLRKKIHKQECRFLNPGNLFEEKLGRSSRYNVLIILIEDWGSETGHKDLISDAQDLALRLHPDPTTKGENQYFRNGSRSLLTFGLVFLVTQYDPDKVTLSELLRLVRNESKLIEAFHVASCSEILNGELADMAADLLKTFEVPDKRQSESFRQGAVQSLEAFAPSGWLAESTSKCDFRFRDLKDTPETVYLIVDPTKMKVFGQWLSIIWWAAITELTRCQNNKPVIFLLDEAANFRLDGLSHALTSLREYGCRVWFVIQELEEFSRQNGRESLETLLSQTEVKQIFGVQSQKTAEMVSKMLGEETVKTSNYSLGHDRNDKVQKSVSENARRLLTPDEVRRFPDSILFVGNMKPIHAHKVSYAQVKPWSKWVDANPFFGKKLKDKIRVWLRY
jgi:type IV secretion system protein VirD4